VCTITRTHGIQISPLHSDVEGSRASSLLSFAYANYCTRTDGDLHCRRIERRILGETISRVSSTRDVAVTLSIITSVLIGFDQRSSWRLTFCLSIRRSSISSSLLGMEMLVFLMFATRNAVTSGNAAVVFCSSAVSRLLPRPAMLIIASALSFDSPEMSGSQAKGMRFDNAKEKETCEKRSYF